MSRKPIIFKHFTIQPAAPSLLEAKVTNKWSNTKPELTTIQWLWTWILQLILGSMYSCYRILSVWGPLPPPGATPTAWNSPRLSGNSQVANSQVANNNSLKSPSAPLKSFESLKPLKSPSSSTAPASPDLLAQCSRPTLLLQRRSAPCIRYKFQIFHFTWCWWLHESGKSYISVLILQIISAENLW